MYICSYIVLYNYVISTSIYIYKSRQRHDITGNNFMLLVPNQTLKYLHMVNNETISNFNFEQLLL